MTDTSFVCAAEDELIFTSDRVCLAYLLLGILQKLSVKLFGEKCTINMELMEGGVQKFRYLIKLEEKKEVVEPKVAVRSVSSNPKDLQMSNKTLCEMFPWHFIMDENLELVQLGAGFSKLFKIYLNSTRNVNSYFKFRRPVDLKIEFNEITKRTNTPFLLSLKSLKPDFPAKGLEIKGMQKSLIISLLIFASHPHRPNGFLSKCKQEKFPHVHRLTVN